MKIRLSSFILCMLIVISGCKSSEVVSQQTVQPPPSPQPSSMPSNLPEWVKSKPVSTQYYYGKGNAPLSNKDFQAVAKEEALADIASEISVFISSNSVLHQIESETTLYETYNNTIKASTSKKIEGHELVNTWRDNHQYWMLYRLSKEAYAKQLENKKALALSKALQAFTLAERQLKTAPANAYSNYCRCLEAIESYVAEDTKVQYNNEHIDIANSCYAKLQRMVSNTKIEVPEKVELTRLKKTSTKINGYIHINDVPFSNLSVSVFDGYSRIEVTSNSEGKISVPLSKLHPNAKSIVIKPLFSQLNTTDSQFVKLLNEKFMVAEFETEILPDVLLLFITAKAYNLGEEKIPIIHRYLESELIANGYNIVENKERADVIIFSEANTRKGSEVLGLYSAYLDVNISAYDTINDKKIYDQSFESIKGIDITYKKAGIKAYKALREMVEKTIIKDLIKYL